MEPFMENGRSLHNATRIELNPGRRTIRSENYFSDFEGKEHAGGDIAEIFHENTKVGQIAEKFTDSIEYFSHLQAESDGAFGPSAERVDLPLIDLPDGDVPDVSLASAVSSRRSVREFDRYSLSADELATLLRYGCGPIGDGLTAGGDLSTPSRGYPSAGGLYPVEPYVIVLDAESIDTGVYFYSASEHGLRVVETMDRDSLLDEVASLSPKWVMEYEHASALLVLTGSFWKSKVKYGPRGYRFALLEAGHMMQTLQLVSASLGLGTCSVGGLDEYETDRFLGINGVDESTVYPCLIGKPSNRGETNGN